MKLIRFCSGILLTSVRTFTGAWIETHIDGSLLTFSLFAPSRVRGLKHVEASRLRNKPKFAPSRVRGLKLVQHRNSCTCCWFAPSRVRGLKPANSSLSSLSSKFAPSRVRGLKHAFIYSVPFFLLVRTFTGAWIETISLTPLLPASNPFAPSRVRGLKPVFFVNLICLACSHLHGCVD